MEGRTPSTGKPCLAGSALESRVDFFDSAERRQHLVVWTRGDPTHMTPRFTGDSAARAFTLELMTLDELEREYTELRQQAEAVRSYL